ncbi:LapA family protein [Cellulomonas sp. HZM]|uniref:LapA family protein n=1 Tax=Cellulomonas sp. HZM TaxID=1454010 RepID=UPI00054D8A15|nr:LapA family protein [Cellulomonas sp. HZM]
MSAPSNGNAPAKPVPWRLILGAVVVVLALVVVLQNTQEARFEVLWATITLPTWVMLSIVFVLGGITGWLLNYRRTKRKA